MVTGEDDDGPLLRMVARGEDGRTRALPLALLGNENAVGQPVGDPVTGPDDADDATGTGRDGGIDDPLDHGLAADRVEDLGSPRQHPRAPAGGHDEDREGVGHGPRRVPAKRARDAYAHNIPGGSSSGRTPGFGP